MKTKLKKDEGLNLKDMKLIDTDLEEFLKIFG